MISDINKKHEYSDIKRTKSQDKKKYRAYISQIILEQNILGIAVSYVNVPNLSFPFPLRSEQRGRLFQTFWYQLL